MPQWLAGWLAVCLAGWLTALLTGWLAGRARLSREPRTGGVDAEGRGGPPAPPRATAAAAAQGPGAVRRAAGAGGVHVSLVAYCLLHTAYCKLTPACYILSIAYCLLLVAPLLLPNSYRILRISYCTLPTVHCFSLSPVAY